MYRRIESESSLRLGTVLVILAVLASAMVVMFMLHAETDDSSAEIIESGSCGPDAHYDYYSDGTLEISGSGWTYNYSGTIRSPWFDYRTDITKIVIGDDITNLGAWTFVGCKNVTELTMPITLHTVGSDLSPAFAGCYRIERIDFTYGTDGHGPGYDAYPVNDCWYQNTPWYESRDSLRELNFEEGIIGIGSDTFRELNITSLVLPNSLSIVGDHCFFNCTKLTELTMSVSLRPFCNTDYPSFQGCMAIEKVTFTRGNGVPYDYPMGWNNPVNIELTPWNTNPDVAKTIVVSDNVDMLGKHMFYGCNIKELVVPVSLQMYDSLAFKPQYHNLEKVTLTKGTGAGKDYPTDVMQHSVPWNYSSNIKTVIVQEGVTRIGGYTFYKCDIESLVLPDTLTSLGECTFYDCSFKNITIPISLNSVWLDSLPAFLFVSGIEKITFTPGDSGNGFNYSAHCPVVGSTNNFYKNTPWYLCRSTLKEIVFEDGIKSIGSDAFRELNITSVVIPDSVQTLSNHSFYHCDKLTDIALPITLDSVRDYTWPAFDQCNAITTVTLTAGKTGIGWDYAADHLPVWCNPSHKASTIIFGSGISHIGDHTLEGFTFTDFDGSVMEPTAENLSGHTFIGNDGNMHITDRIPSSSVSYFYLHSVVEPVSARNRF